MSGAVCTEQKDPTWDSGCAAVKGFGRATFESRRGGGGGAREARGSLPSQQLSKRQFLPVRIVGFGLSCITLFLFFSWKIVIYSQKECFDFLCLFDDFSLSQSNTLCWSLCQPMPRIPPMPSGGGGWRVDHNHIPDAACFAARLHREHVLC